MRKKYIFLLFLVLLFGFIVRLPLHFQPLDNDEGMFAYFAFYSKGERFYADTPFLKLPGIIFIYRFLDNFFPGSIISFRAAGTFLLFMAILSLYGFGNLLLDRRVGILSAVIFSFLPNLFSLRSPANTEYFMMPFTVFSYFLFLLYLKKEKEYLLALSGLCLGVAVFFKQPAFFEGLFLCIWILLKNLNLKKKKLNIKSVIKEGLIFGIFAFLPLIFSVIYFIGRGEFHDFLWHSFKSGSSYVSIAWAGFGWAIRLKNLCVYFWEQLWPIVLAGLIGLIFISSKIIKRKKREEIFIFGWFFFALLGACFNGWFFLHYFIQIVPAVSIIIGYLFVLFYDFTASKLKCKKLFMNNLFLLFLFLFIHLTLKDQYIYITSFYNLLSKKITQMEYYQKIGVDITDDGWLPFYSASEYLEKKIKPSENLYVWSTNPLPYYLIRKRPIYSFEKNYSVLDYQFMLATSQGWKIDFESNRRKLITELINSPPAYILFDVHPRQVFDQMLIFKELSNFISRCYLFERQFGNLMIFKFKEDVPINKDFITGDYLEIPIELVKRYSAITRLENTEGTKLIFEPMVYTAGTVPQYQISYSGEVDIKYHSISAELLGKDGKDFVGNSLVKPSGEIDLHIRVLSENQPISFLRVRSGDIIWSNRPYGVYSPIKVFQEGGEVDLYFEAPSEWEKKEYELHIIYSDGSLAKATIPLILQ